MEDKSLVPVLNRVRLQAPFILEHFGVDNQISKAIEEMSELTKELCKLQQRKSHSTKQLKAIQEEIADVFVTIYQMREHFGAKKIDEYIDKKLDRVLKKVSRVDEPAILTHTAYQCPKCGYLVGAHDIKYAKGNPPCPRCQLKKLSEFIGVTFSET